jgi:MraZ protein
VVDIDSLGRVLILKIYLFWQYHQGSRFSSAVNIVEIWDKDLYETSINGEDVDFADLAEEVMGNINDDDNGIS